MSRVLAFFRLRFEALSRRERWIVAVGLVALVLGLSDRAFLQPLELRASELAAQRELFAERAQALAEAQALLARQLGGDADAPGPTGQLRAAIDAVDARIAARAALFVSPRDMMQLLGALLEEQPGVHVENIAALEPVELAGAEGDGPDGPKIYRHGLQVDLEASYADTLAFLTRLEQLPWAIFWERLEYEVIEYPRARVQLLVHTLSTAEQWRDA